MDCPVCVTLVDRSPGEEPAGAVMVVDRDGLGVDLTTHELGGVRLAWLVEVILWAVKVGEEE